VKTKHQLRALCVNPAIDNILPTSRREHNLGHIRGRWSVAGFLIAPYRTRAAATALSVYAFSEDLKKTHHHHLSLDTYLASFADDQ
jgi:hypothetical protein